MGRPRKPNNRFLAVEIPDTIKARLKLEGFRQNRHVKDLVAEILDRNLPRFADVLDNQVEAVELEPSQDIAANETTDEATRNGGTKIQHNLISR